MTELDSGVEVGRRPPSAPPPPGVPWELPPLAPRRATRQSATIKAFTMPGGIDDRVRGGVLAARVAALLAAGAWAASVTGSPALASDFDVVLSEIHYHPFGSGDPNLEFVELH